MTTPDAQAEVPPIQPRDVYEALEAARADFPPLVADADNPFTKSRYATLAAVKGLVEPVLRQHGLAVFQTVRENFLLTELRYMGQLDEGADRSLLATYPLVVNDNPQQAASSLTYARRYSLTTLLGLVVDRDDDGNSASGRKDPGPPAQATQPPVAALLPPLPEGWDDHAQAQAAHRALTERIVALDNDEVKAAARTFRDEHGWPLTVARFNELEDIVKTGETFKAAGA